MPNQTPDYRISRSIFRFMHQSIIKELNTIKKHPQVRDNTVYMQRIQILEERLNDVEEIFKTVLGG